MAARKIKENVYYVGAIDWSRRLFDALIPTPDGTSYNSYLVKGSEKTALIDTVDETKLHELLANLEDAGVESVDYIVSNHSEQDHAGLIPTMLEKYPGAKVVTNPKCRDLLKEHLLLEDDVFIVKKDGETLSLGDKTLQFIMAPWVHWPETQFTYLVEDKILFSCDFLGSHLATSKILVKDCEDFYWGAKRYYAEIMMPFATNVRKHLEKIRSMDVEMIGPSHGPVYTDPEQILRAYEDWSSDKVKNEVVIPFVSMHGSTLKMVEYLTDRLVKRGIMVKPFDLVVTDTGNFAMELVDAATVVFGAPTVLVGAHPKAIYAAALTNALRPKTRFIGVIGSFGWGSRMLDQLTGILANLSVEMLSPVVIKGYPKAGDLSALDNLADEILEKHKEANLVA
jgi:flavorubredoxin